MSADSVLNVIRVAIKDIGSTALGLWCLWLQVDAREIVPGLMALTALCFMIPTTNIGVLRGGGSDGSDTSTRGSQSPSSPSSQQPPQSQQPSQPTSST